MESEHNPIQVMLDEHEIISKAEELIQKLDHYWERSEGGFVHYVYSLLTFFREFSDKYHHYKEEQVLFPKMADHIDFQMHSMLAELADHHEMFREYTSSIEHYLNNNQCSIAYSVLSKYMDELLDHIAAENDELFVMAEVLFSTDDLENMFYSFKDIDIELGESRKAELSNTLTELNLSIDKDHARERN